MAKWTKRLANILATGAFLITLLICYDFVNPYSIGTIIAALIKASIAGLMFWFAGMIISDILLKGVVSDVPPDPEHLVEGGILQRIYLYQQSLVPGSKENILIIQNADDEKKPKKSKAKSKALKE
ncbi:MAG: hypothetical protein ACLFVE_05250 [Chitinispirillaceae bacterium]